MMGYTVSVNGEPRLSRGTSAKTLDRVRVRIRVRPFDQGLILNPRLFVLFFASRAEILLPSPQETGILGLFSA